jgi:mRNA interferase RelE/StbE
VWLTLPLPRSGAFQTAVQIAQRFVLRRQACQQARTAKECTSLRYHLQITEKAREQLRCLPRDLRRAIGYRMEVMRDDLRGDIVKLRDKSNRYRLRVGTFRVLFVLAVDTIRVYAVKDRKAAYE